MKQSRLKKILSPTLIVMLMTVLVVGGLPMFAQHHDDDDDDDFGEGGRNWELMIGGGTFYEPTFDGADAMKYEPVPVVMGFYSTGYFKLFVEGDEAGVGVRFGENVPISLSIGAGLADGRDNADDDLLKGTATLKSNYKLFGSLNADLPFVELSVKANYHPFTAKYDEIERGDKDYTGILIDAEMKKEWMVVPFEAVPIPFMIEIGGGVSWMNNDYAEAKYGVTYATDKLNTFTAKSGLRSINLSSMIGMFFSERMGTALMLDGKYFLGDAADSPLTENDYDISVGAFAFYRF
jgi:outer membrane scaffolding protein for murein synthesis (MipA/OmpV family)